jgi:branched-chain amino acid transport system substrate-binding protein
MGVTIGQRGPLRRRAVGVLTLAAVPLIITACSSSSSSTNAAAGSTSGSTSNASPYVIAAVDEISGPISQGRQGDIPAAQAAVDAQNAAGGINGHPLKLVAVDSQSSAAGAVSAFRAAVTQDHAIAIVEATANTDPSAPFLHQENEPEIGLPNGTSWGAQPYTNQFGDPWIVNANPTATPFTVYAKYLKAQGVTKLAILDYAGLGSYYQQSQAEVGKLAEQMGMKVALLDQSIPLAGSNATTIALAVKNSGADGVFFGIADTDMINIMTAIYDQGVKVKSTVAQTGYDSTLITSVDKTVLNAENFTVAYPFAPESDSSAGVKTMLATFSKYAPSVYPQSFVGYNEEIMYSGVETAIAGIKAAGPNPTNASVVKALQGLKNWNANGIWPNTVSYGTQFGTSNQKCVYYIKVVNGAYQVQQPAPYCGIVENT